MKIYTKTGDQGETGLLGGVRVAKNHACIIATGSIDETNSMLGVVRSFWHGNGEHDDVLQRVQNDLFDLGSRVAASLGSSDRAADFPETRAQWLEQQIDQYQERLPPLTAFILPSGGSAGSMLHLARSVCRRAERDVVSLIEVIGNANDEQVSESDRSDLSQELIYLNRLSDFLFVFARFVNHEAQIPETLWVVGGNN